MDSKKSDVLLVGIAFLMFMVYGLNAGLMGVAWPSIRDAFGVGDDAFGVIAFVSSLGSLVVTFYSGRLIRRFGIGVLLLTSCIVGSLGFLGYALSPTWGAIVAFGLLSAVGVAAINPGINTYFATNESAGRMNWLHACFGLGATVGPAVMTFILNGGYSWRWGYVLVVISYAALALAFGFTLKRWPRPASASGGETPQPSSSAHSKDTLLLPAVWVSLLLFFVFTGMEASAGQWPYTLFTEVRGIDAATAGVWVSVYWASMTVGRIFFGIIVDRVKTASLVRVCMGAVICGAALVWWNVNPSLGFLGLALIGFAVSPLFPVLTSNTPERLGAEHAANAIGYQITAVKLGLAAIPALGGVLAEAWGLEIIGPFLFVISIAMFLLHEVTLSDVVSR